MANEGTTLTANTTIGLSHVVTWTGKKWSELRNGPEGWRYDPAQIGEPGSRLGGDLAYIPKNDDVQAALTSLDPYMNIDSHMRDRLIARSSAGIGRACRMCGGSSVRKRRG